MIVLRLLYLIYQIIGIPLIAIASALYAIAIYLGCTLGFVNFWAHKVGMMWGRTILALGLLPVEIRGAEHRRKGQSYVVVSNHQSSIDAPLMYGFLGLPFKWLMKKEVQKIPFIGAACKACGHIFVDRQSTTKSTESLDEARLKLKDGISVMIFAEGTRSGNGQVGQFKKGAFQLSQQLQLPLLPVTISGTYQAMSRNAWHLTWHKIVVEFHPEIAPINTEGMTQQEMVQTIKQQAETARQIITGSLITD